MSHRCRDSTLNSQPKGSWINPRTPQKLSIYLYLLTCPSLTDSEYSNKAKRWVATPAKQNKSYRLRNRIEFF
jgi:hypothetical protein